jgi:hypothetical protein
MFLCSFGQEFVDVYIHSPLRILGIVLNYAVKRRDSFTSLPHLGMQMCSTLRFLLAGWTLVLFLRSRSYFRLAPCGASWFV